MKRLLPMFLILLLAGCGFHLRQASSNKTQIIGDDNTLTTSLVAMLGSDAANNPSYSVTLTDYKVINQSINFINNSTPSTGVAAISIAAILKQHKKKIAEKTFTITSTQILNANYSYHPHPAPILLTYMQKRLSHEIYYWIKTNEKK